MVVKRQSPLLAGEGRAGTADQHAGPTDNPALPKVEREKQLEREKCSICIPKSFLVCCTLSVVEIIGVCFYNAITHCIKLFMRVLSKIWPHRFLKENENEKGTIEVKG